MKRVLLIALAILMVLAPIARAEGQTDIMAEAVKSYQPFELNGQEVTIGGYLINGNNYYKLRDVAALLSETEKKFNVVFDDEKKQIGLELGKGYKKLDTDLQEMKYDKTAAKMVTNTILVDGKEVELKAALIDRNNYVKLRDIGKVAQFLVDYNKETKAIIVDTSADYKEESKAVAVDPNATVPEVKEFLSSGKLDQIQDSFKDGGLLEENDGHYLIVKTSDGQAVKIPLDIYQEIKYDNMEELLEKQTLYLAQNKDTQLFVKNPIHYYFLKGDRFTGDSLDTLSIVDDFAININKEHKLTFDLFKNNLNIPYYLGSDKKALETAPLGIVEFAASYSDGSVLDSSKLEDISKIPFYTADKKGRLTVVTMRISIQDFKMHTVVFVI